MRRSASRQSSNNDMEIEPQKKLNAEVEDKQTKVLRSESSSEKYITRVPTSPGYWLCALLPLAYVANHVRYPKTSAKFEYCMTTILSLGLCLQSIYIFICISKKTSKPLRILCVFIPGITTSLCIYFALNQTIIVSCFWGLGATLSYNYAYRTLLHALPKSFTYGEASVATEGLIMFLAKGIIQVPGYITDSPRTDIEQMNAIMIAAFMCLIVALGVLYLLPFMRKPVLFYSLMIGLVCAVCTVPVTEELPVITLWNFLISDMRRIFLIIFYFGLVGLTIVALNWILGKVEKASTSLRKLFHLLVVLVYIPGLIYQCSFLYIASGVALAVITVIETVRVLKVPPLYEVLEQSFMVLADEKDSGIVALTPFYLLVGCSLPLWISSSLCVVTNNALQNLIPLLAGVLTVGVGDTAASTIGSTIGKHKWPSTNKTIEGTVANILSQAAVVCALFYLGYVNMDLKAKFATGLAITLSSLTEAFTDQVDNLVLPLIFYIICIFV